MTPNNTLIIRSLLHALGVLIYTAFAAGIISSGDTLFGDEPHIWGGIAFLMLFVLSAAVVGLLIFLKPVTLFINGDRKEAINFLTATIAWLTILTTLILTARVLLL